MCRALGITEADFDWALDNPGAAVQGWHKAWLRPRLERVWPSGDAGWWTPGVPLLVRPTGGLGKEGFRAHY